MKKNDLLANMFLNISRKAIEFANVQTDLEASGRVSPGKHGTAARSIPTLNLVGHQSAKFTLFVPLNEAADVLISNGVGSS